MVYANTALFSSAFILQKYRMYRLTVASLCSVFQCCFVKVVQLSVCIVACALKCAWCVATHKGTDLDPGERLLVF